MIAQTAAFLFCFGVLALLKPVASRGRASTFVLTALFIVLFMRLMQWSGALPNTDFSILWDTSPAGDIRLELSSSRTVFVLIVPFFAVTALSLVRNLFVHDELPTRVYVGWCMLNLLCLTMLAAGRHFIQLITFVFVIDILAQILIKNMRAGRSLALYNLIADLGLFWVLAILNGNVESLNIVGLQKYHHRDLVAVLLMISLCLKFGFCLIPSYVAQIKDIRLHRLIVLSYVSAPAAAWLLLMQLHALLEASHLFVPMLDAVTLIVLSVAAYGVLKSEDFSVKMLFLNAAVAAFAMKTAQSEHFMPGEYSAWIWILGFALNILLYDVYRQKSCLSLTESCRRRYALLTYFLATAMLLVGAFAAQSAALIRTSNLLWCAVFALSFIPLSADMFRRLCPPTLPAVPVKTGVATRLFEMILPIVGLGALWCIRWNWSFALTAASLWLLCFVTDPFKNVRRYTPRGNPSSRQWRRIRIGLWRLPEDRRHNSFETLEKLLEMSVGLFRKLNRFALLRSLIWLLVGVGFMLFCIGRSL
jgi:hypothetical protein